MGEDDERRKLSVMGFLDRFFKKAPEHDGFLTDDEKELREYEENEYRGESRLEESAYAEYIVSDTFAIQGRGTVVVGTVTEGTFRVGDKVAIIHGNNPPLETTIAGIEQFKKVTESVSEGANAGLLLKGVQREQVKRNDIIKKYTKE